MCGIAGIISPLDYQFGAIRDAGYPLGSDSPMEAMIAALRHRGPDDEGTWSAQVNDSQVILGHTRLSIIDLSSAAKQPMIDEDSGCVLVYNGEIYNFAELRAEIISAEGRPFISTGDTEVLLRAYLHWGPGFVNKLRGMFAFGIYDLRQRKLILGRDHFGIKPLYLTERIGGYFAFASEVRALLTLPWVRRKLDPLGLMGYLAYGSVQHPYTLVSGIISFPPGHTITIDLPSGEPIVQEPVPFWQFSDILTKTPSNVSFNEATEMIRAALTESVSLHLVSDVPLGVFLSGGIDSSSIVALMAEANHSAIHTLTVSFEETEFDESMAARAMADRYGTVHSEVRLTGEDFLKDLPTWLKSQDQPSADGANAWIISRACKEAGVTVALSGLGGDELFAGYHLFRRVNMARRLYQIFGCLPQNTRAKLGRMIRRTTDDSISGKKLAEWISSDGSILSTYLILRRMFLPAGLEELLSPWVTNLFGNCAIHAGIKEKLGELSRSHNPYVAVGALEMNTYLLNTLLQDADRMSMAHSIEIRVPFVDRGVVESALPILGLAKKNKKAGQKPLLYAASQDKIDSNLLNQPKKTFSFPFDNWLRGPMRSEIEDVLPGLRDFPFLPEGISNLWQNFLSNSNRVNSARILTLFALCCWMKRHGIESPI